MSEGEKLELLRAKLLTVGIPVGYEEYPDEDEATMPYIVFSTGKTRNFCADGEIFRSYLPVTVILCGSNVDFCVEKKIENALDQLEIIWNKGRNFENRDIYYETIYTFEF